LPSALTCESRLSRKMGGEAWGSEAPWPGPWQELVQSEGGTRERAAQHTAHDTSLGSWAPRRRGEPGGFNNFLSKGQLAKTMLQKPTI